MPELEDSKAILSIKDKIIILCILLLVLIGSFAFETLTLLFLVIYIIVGIFAGILNNKVTIYFFLFSILFQNLILICCSDYLASWEHTTFSIVKEGTLYIAVLTSLSYRKKDVKITPLMIISFLYGILLLKNFFVSSASFTSKIVSLRQSLVPFICVYVGNNVRINNKELKKILKIVFILGLIISFSGIFELYFLGDDFWLKLGLHDFIINKQGDLPSYLYNGVTVNFYTWDFGAPTRRLISLLADPLASAHLIFLALAIMCSKNLVQKDSEIICIDHKSKKVNVFNILCIMVLLYACIMSYSKAIYIFMIISTFVLPVYKSKDKAKKILIIAILIFLFPIAIYSVYLVSTGDGSIGIHINGLVSGLSTANLFGHGLGVTGYLAKSRGEIGGQVAGLESYIGSLAQQLGIIGVIVFVVYIGFIFITLSNKYRAYHSNFTLLTLMLLIGLTVEMVFSESSVSIMGTGIYFILIGIAYSKRNNF